MADLEVTRALVARACRVVGKLELARGTTGHVSARADDGTILVRGRGPGETGVRYTETADVLAVDPSGRKLDGPADLDAPHEVFIHTALYRADPETRAVVHVHPRTIVLFTITGTPLLPLYGAYDPGGLRLALEGGIANYPRSVLIAGDRLGDELTSSMGRARACLMRGHGLTTRGASVEEAVDVAVRVAELAEVNYRARLLGEPRPIPDEDLADFRSRSAGTQGWRQEAAWRYYCRVTGEEEGETL